MKLKTNMLLIFMIVTMFLSINLFYNSRIYADGTQVQIAGTIRNVGLGWNVLNNDAHMPLNITGDRTDGDKIVIFHNVSAKKVTTFIVTPDETMTSKDILLVYQEG